MWAIKEVFNSPTFPEYMYSQINEKCEKQFMRIASDSNIDYIVTCSTLLKVG